MTRPKHTVSFDDTPDNWLRWGTLVEEWIFNGGRPTNVGELEDQMIAKKGVLHPGPGITGVMIAGQAVPNPNPGRAVSVPDYDPLNGPITITVPEKSMVRSDRRYLRGLGDNTYPLWSFYSIMFGGAPQVVLTQKNLQEMGLRRLGEYVINECM